MAVRAKSVISILTFMSIWEVVSRLGFVNTVVLPPISSVLMTYLSPEFLRLLITNYVLTAIRAASGFTLGLLAGIGLGILVSVKSMHEFIQPIATLFFAIPSVAWVPILIVWVGIKELELPLVASFLCAFPPIFYGMINALRTFDRDEVDAALTLGADPKTVFLKVILPQVLLRIVPQVKTEAVMTWKTVFVTEMVALSSGLGYLAMTYATSLEMSKLLAVIFTLTITTLAIIEFFEYVERLFSRRWFGGTEWLR